ncbi:MAG TPA: DUF3800 domain-containing protein [Candidatus Elarobacter sp.]|nr:DUF3800 domain-containing protein [Candidatus Elarobacter sp.]
MTTTPDQQHGAAPPPSGAFPFIFTDESGVVSTAATQPFYGVGMLKVSDAGRWSDALNLMLDRYVTTQAKAGSRKARTAYEFKFSAMTTGSRAFYEALIDYFVQQPDGYFCALVVDKRGTGIAPATAGGSTWDALIAYSMNLIRRNIATGEKAILISDYYQKPRKHPKFYERELISALGGAILNATMMDSGASIMLQLVDVLLGAVMYHFKLPAMIAIDADKRAVADRLSAAYGIPTLGAAITKTAPNYFSVWPFRPRVAVVTTAAGSP